MHILPFPVIEQQPAIRVILSHIQAVLPEKIHHNVAAQHPQIPSDQKVVVLRPRPRLSKERREGIVSCRGHGRAHVVCILDAHVNNAPAGDVGNIRPVPLGAQDAAAGGRSGPLGRRCALVAVEHRHPVLPLGGAEMGAGHSGHDGGKAAIDKQSRQGQAFAHGGTGTIEAIKGDFEVPKAKGGADALIQQIPCQHIVQVLRYKSPLLHGPP